MSPRHGQFAGDFARRALVGSVAAWLVAVGGVAGVACLAIQSAGYAVTGQRQGSVEVKAPDVVVTTPGSPASSTGKAPSPTRATGSPPATKSATTRGSAAGAATTTGGGRPGGGGPASGAGTAGSDIGGGGGTDPATAGVTSTGGVTTSSSSGGGHRGGPPISSSSAPTGSGSSSASSSSTQPSAPSSTPSAPATATPASQWTSGGFVVAECVGSKITYWNTSPSGGWSSLQGQRNQDAVLTGFKRIDHTILVTITCGTDGTPNFAVSSRSD